MGEKFGKKYAGEPDEKSEVAKSVGEKRVGEKFVGEKCMGGRWRVKSLWVTSIHSIWVYTQYMGVYTVYG